MMTPLRAARTALACLDLTNLDDGCTPGDIDALCARAITPHGPVAAVCLWPRFVAQARARLAGSPVRIATVVNFPGGTGDAAGVAAMTVQAVAEGADEIDMVIPYCALRAGDAAAVATMVATVRAAAMGRLLKVILETGELREPALIARAALLAIEGGADFIKTSTGKVAVNATPEAAGIMLSVIATTRRPVGFKPAGGVRTTADSACYLSLAEAALGSGWPAPATFRFGASGVLTALLATLDGAAAPASGAGY